MFRGKAKLEISGKVLIEHRKADGRLVHRQVVKNQVLNQGLEWLKGLMGNAGTAPVLLIGVSTGVSAPAAGDTDLGATVMTTDGLARAAGTYASGATGVFTCSKVFTCATNPHTIASVGLYYAAATPNNLFAGVAIDAAALVPTDTLTFAWTITITAV